MRDLKNWKLYALQLNDDCYYVGITSMAVEKRYNQHAASKGAHWTSLHKPIKILYEEDLGVCTKELAEEKEQKLFEKFEHEYGTEYVRGGDKTNPIAQEMHFGKRYVAGVWQLFVLNIVLLVLLAIVIIWKF